MAYLHRVVYSVANRMPVDFTVHSFGNVVIHPLASNLSQIFTQPSVCRSRGVLTEQHLAVILRAFHCLFVGNPRVVTSSVVLLPLTLVAKACKPSKSASNNVTIEINKPAVSLEKLFSGTGLL